MPFDITTATPVVEKEGKSFTKSKFDISTAISYFPEKEKSFARVEKERYFSAYKPTFKDKFYRGLEAIGLRPGTLERIGKAQAHYLEATELSEKEKIDYEKALSSVISKDRSDAIGAMRVLADVIVRTPKAIGIAVLKMHQGAEGASVTDRGWTTRMLRNADIDSAQFAKEVLEKYQQKRVLPGVPIKITDVGQLSENLAFSITSMGSGLAVGAPIFIAPVPGARVAAWTTGTVASGKAAFEMATYEIMQEYLEFKNEESIEKTGKGLSPIAEKTLKFQFNKKATQFGLWEAIPEALSNLAFAAILTAPLAKVVGGKLAGRIVTKMVGIYGEELLTETITEKGQVRIRREAGLEPGEPDITWEEAFKRIAPQTFLLSTIMAGTGATIIKTKQALSKSLKREIGTDHPEYEKTAQDIDRLTEAKKVAPPEMAEPRKIPPTPEITPKEAIVEPIPEEIKPLVEEAKKFETVEEFMEAKKKEDITKPQLTAIWEQAQKEIGIDIKAKQIKGRLAKLDSEIRDVRKEIDALEKQKTELKKLGKSTKQIEAKITELTKKEDVIDSERADLLISQKEAIKLGKEKIEITAQELFKNIEQGIREGTIKTKEEIKTVQEEIITGLEKSKLEAKDKAKFIKTIKNVQTVQQLNKALPEIQERIGRLVEQAGKTHLDIQIKKELKKTKPLKKGQKRIEKYEYESSKLFKALRGYDKMNQAKAQAELDSYPEEGLSELDLIKKRFLSLKANGKEASIEIYNKVLSDIQEIKEIGQAVKDDAEMMAKINQQDVIDNAQEAMEKIKTTTKEYKRKARVAYLRGVGNINSMLNAIFGKKIGDEFNPELEENARGTAIFHQGKKVSDAAEKMYNGDIVSILKKMTEDTYDIVDSTGLSKKINKRDVINIYNAIKNEHIKKRFFDSFGETQITALMGKLDTVDKEFGDMMMTTVQGYKDIHNQMSIETTGRDNGVVENYWPANSEYNQNVYDDIRIQGETSSAQKERARGKVLPKLVDSWDVAMKHIAQGEHVDKLSRKYIELKRLLSDVAIKDRIIDYYGKKIYSDLMNLVEGVSLNALGEQVDIISAVTGHMVNSWVVSKIAFNPSTLVRQLISTGFYTETMGLTEWGKGFVEGVKSPKETFNFMWKNAPFLEARFNRGYSEALSNALEGASKLSEVASSATKLFTVLARSGDITAIIYGGYPMVKAELAKHGDMKKAIAVFEAATIKAQQSGLSSSRSLAQNNRNGFMRMFFAFKNTPSQFARKLGDAIISFENKDIGKSQLAKTLIIYGVISPVAYILAGYLTALPFVWLRSLLGNVYDDDEEDKAIREIIVQLIVNPVNWAPGISHITNYYARKVMGLKAYKLADIPVIDDVYKGMRKLEKKEPTFLDYLQALSSITEPIIPNPGNTFIRYYNKVMKTSGRKEYK